VFLAKAAVSAGLLWLLASRVPLGDAATAVAGLPLATVALAVMIYLAAHCLSAARLRVFLPELSLRQALRFTFLALFYGAALPGQLAGDAVKAVRLMRLAGGGDAGRAAAAVALDKIIGLFGLLVLTALGLGVAAPGTDAELGRVLSAFVLIAVAGLAILLWVEPPAWFGRWGQAFRIWRAAHLTGGALLASLGLGVLFQLLSIAVFVMLASGLGLALPLAAWAVIVGLLSLALLLPVTIAGVGVRDVSLVGLVAAYGGEAAPALALSLCLLALTVLGALIGLAAELTGHDRTS
jgi:uncharacterized membrane protein YbhN (UPF0104 family)